VTCIDDVPAPDEVEGASLTPVVLIPAEPVCVVVDADLFIAARRPA